jgi:hypothetical protein
MGCYSKSQLLAIKQSRAKRATEKAKLALWGDLVRLLESVARTDRSNQPWLNDTLVKVRAIEVEDQPQ